MKNQGNRRPVDFFAPLGTAEELAAAIESATGEEQSILYRDPMDGASIRDAFEQLLMTPRPDRGLDVLVRSGVMEAVFPEVAAMVGFGEGIRHKDVWMHTKKVLLRSPPRIVVRWAALLHDIGKVPTRRFEPDGQVTFIGHPVVGARMFSHIAQRIPWPNDMRKRIRFLILFHLRASAYDESWTDSAVRRFARDIGEGLGDLLDLSRADITSKYIEKVQRGIELIDALERRVKEIAELDAKPAPLPKGLGNVLINELGIAPGPKLGELMRHLAQQVEAGALGVQEGYEHYLEYVVKNPSLMEGVLGIKSR